MQNRRDFLKQTTLLGAAASLPISFALGQKNVTKDVTKTIDPLFAAPDGMPKLYSTTMTLTLKGEPLANAEVRLSPVDTSNHIGLAEQKPIHKALP
ncbi:MAG: twin-arginine translocation signal domain-containing protein [Planctomycetaceae bacterium]|jgi:hypothetical protein|nr:twin-arginine translocation signal domain-containing protein [Planctomycetaceae bacterium]